MTRCCLRLSAGYYIFVTGELPFYSEAVTDLFEIIAEAKTSIPDTLSDHSTRIISGLLKVDVDTRLTVGDLEENAWLKEVSALRPPPVATVAKPERKSRISRLSVSASDIASAFSTVKAKQNFSGFFGGAKKSFTSALHSVGDAMHNATHSHHHAAVAPKCAPNT